MPYQLPSLPYGYDALAPHIDARTMEIHHTKHHQGYVNNVNAAIEGTDFDNKPIEELVAALGACPKTSVRPFATTAADMPTTRSSGP